MINQWALLFSVFAAAQMPGSSGASSGAMPSEIVVKGSGGSQLNDVKPPLKIEVDEFETVRDDLKPDSNLLLAASPYTAVWRRTHPDFLMNERVIQPWRLPFSERPGVSLRVREKLESLLGGKIDRKAAHSWSWSLTLADEEGRVFQHYEGPSDPPEELVWNGRNNDGEWARAGRAYSAVYNFTGPDGSPRTSVGQPIVFRGVAHQEDAGLYLSLDSSLLFGTSRTAADIQAPEGVDLLRSTADFVKRRYVGIPVSVRVFAGTKELGAAQAAAMQSFLLREFMVPVRSVTADSSPASFSDQRVEVVLLNR